MDEARPEREPVRLAYACPPPRPPWQMGFFVVATLVCAGTLMAGMLVHALRLAVAPAVQGPAATTQPVRERAMVYREQAADWPPSMHGRAGRDAE